MRIFGRINKAFKIPFVICLALACTVLISSCTAEKRENNRLSVVTTLFPQYDFARAIGGDRVTVTKLLPWGSESHTYDPSIRDITEVSRADVFLFTGTELERWTSSIAEAAKESDCRIVDLSKNITLIKGTDNHEHLQDEDNYIDHSHAEDFDVHIWTSPKNALVMAREILGVFCELDAENSEYYTENADKLFAQLTELDHLYTSLSEKYNGDTLYFGGRFAFLYLFNEYGFSYRSPYQGCGEEAEPSIRTITEICNGIKNDGVKYVFYEEMSEGKIAKSIAEETGAKLLLLHSCHNLTYDEADAGKDYVSVMTDNYKALSLALGQ